MTDELTLLADDAGGCARFGVAAQTCRWKCGSQCAAPAPNRAASETFAAVLRRRLSRRSALQGLLAVGAGIVLTPHRTGTAAAAEDQPLAIGPGGSLAFASIGLNSEDRIGTPPGYASKPLIRWGDPLFAGDPAFDPAALNPAAQARRFGYNNDYIGFLPLPDAPSPDRALLVVNHEYTNPELMFAGYSAAAPTKEQVDVELAAHGLTVVEIERRASEWSYVAGSRMNRRITGETPVTITGPAAGYSWLQTSADPAGRTVLGTLNNCSAGKTPWGTVLTCEENFNQYFANVARLPDGDPRKAAHSRYGLPTGASERKWERFYPRFDAAQEPNEAFRFGWAVEVDPADPASTPRKRTALGRFKHEAATFLVGADGRVGVYMGDDERFDYAYKFVTAGSYQPGNASANAELLDSGTLYVARFNDDGSGDWLPLRYGEGALTEALGFTSQADVLVRARQAGDAAGATKMDRPEDFEVHPLNRKIYMAMTNNTRRTDEQLDRANPRAANRDGHIIEVSEDGGNPASERFTWEIFMLCGAAGDPSRYSGGFPTESLSPISSPDNLLFDRAGNLWIFTDGQPGTLRVNDAVFAVPVEGPSRGQTKVFLTGVPGSETAAGDLSLDNEALFVSIQHPAEGSPIDRPSTRFPDGAGLPRPSVVVAWRPDGGIVGS